MNQLNMTTEMKRFGSSGLYPSAPLVDDYSGLHVANPSVHGSMVSVASKVNENQSNPNSEDGMLGDIENMKEKMRQEFRCVDCYKKLRRCKKCIDRKKDCRRGNRRLRLTRSVEKLNEVGRALGDRFTEMNRGIVRILKFISIVLMFIGLIVGFTNLFPQIWKGEKKLTNTTAIKVQIDNLLGRIDDFVDSGMPISRRIRDVTSSRVIVIDEDHYTKCVYWMGDCKGMVVPHVVATRGLNFSLHGAWGNESENDSIEVSNCLTIDEFEKVFIQPVHFIDMSPRSNFSCCYSQYHEYMKHGCHQGQTYDSWYHAIVKCISEFDVSKLIAHQCRYDKTLGVNVAQTASNVDLGQVGCVPGKATVFPEDESCSSIYEFDENYSLRMQTNELVNQWVVINKISSELKFIKFDFDTEVRIHVRKLLVWVLKLLKSAFANEK